MTNLSKLDNYEYNNIILINLFKLFQIDLTNFLKTRIVLMENLHIQPSEIDNMQYWEYEITIEEYQNILKERKEQQETQQEGQSPNNLGDINKLSNNLMRSAQNSVKMPSMPNLSKFSI